MATTVTVPLTLRPLDWAMFTDITDVPVMTLNAAGIVFDGWLSPDEIARVRIRLMTANAASEQTVLKAWTAIGNNNTFLGLASPTNADAVAQIQALTRQMNAVIAFVLQLSS